jgi:hypothetical protein
MWIIYTLECYIITLYSHVAMLLCSFPGWKGDVGNLHHFKLHSCSTLTEAGIRRVVYRKWNICVVLQVVLALWSLTMSLSGLLFERKLADPKLLRNKNRTRSNKNGNKVQQWNVVRRTLCLKTKLCAFSPQANYTDGATATCRRS